MLVFPLNEQFQHRWGVSALFRWFPLTQARRNAGCLDSSWCKWRLALKVYFFGSLPFAGESVVGCWKRFCCLQSPSSVFSCSWISLDGQGKQAMLSRPGCDLTVSMSVKSRRSFHIDFSINCWLQELVAPSWAMVMPCVVCFLLTFLNFWLRVFEGYLVQDSLHVKGCHWLIQYFAVLSS